MWLTGGQFLTGDINGNVVDTLPYSVLTRSAPIARFLQLYKRLTCISALYILKEIHGLFVD